MVKSVDRTKAFGYITKAEKSLRVAKFALGDEAYDAAIMNAVHSAINALDALTTSSVGKRSSGSHTEVLSLLKGILPSKEYVEIEKQFKPLLGLKNASEYQPVFMTVKDAQNSLKCAERILAKVKAKI
jgi:HEPN domain-containing protein